MNEFNQNFELRKVETGHYKIPSFQMTVFEFQMTVFEREFEIVLCQFSGKEMSRVLQERCHGDVATKEKACSRSIA